MLKISSKYSNKCDNYHRHLIRHGFGAHRDGHGAVFYTRASESRRVHWMRWASKRGLKCVVLNDKGVRSTNYRRSFLTFNKGIKGDGQIYRCAYCGKKIFREKMEVDHIFPCHKAANSSLTRFGMRLWGIHTVNDNLNLVASCHRCNHKKGSKGGIWIIRGLLGRSEGLWRVRKVVRIFILICLIALVAATLNKAGQTPAGKIMLSGVNEMLDYFKLI